MQVQMIELEEVTMVDVSDAALETVVIGGLFYGSNTTEQDLC